MADATQTKELQLKLRFSEDLRDRLAEAASINGASLNSEILRRLEASLAQDQVAGSAATAAFLASITAEIVAIEAATGLAWTDDLRTYGAVRFAIAEAVADRMPCPPEYAARVRETIVETRGLTLAVSFAGDVLNDRLPASIFPDAAKWKETMPADLDKMLSDVNRKNDELTAELNREADRGRIVFEEIREQRDQIARLRKRP
ncbi:Arc family DNA-binding protein [Sphingomonas sp. PB2P19]|uniref:Arc family DNA-binding protein n=1 Tax=Sphingomonas rhamnosi TaxID=3096156 RepID=UPI002FCAA198